MFTQYLAQENTQKNLMDRSALNIEKNKVLISQSQQQGLFISNQEEADTRIALHWSESSKPVLVLPQFHCLTDCDTGIYFGISATI